jgi:hypothetical protein
LCVVDGLAMGVSVGDIGCARSRAQEVWGFRCVCDGGGVSEAFNNNNVCHSKAMEKSSSHPAANPPVRYRWGHIRVFEWPATALGRIASWHGSIDIVITVLSCYLLLPGVHERKPQAYYATTCIINSADIKPEVMRVYSRILVMFASMRQCVREQYGMRQRFLTQKMLYLAT